MCGNENLFRIRKSSRGVKPYCQQCSNLSIIDSVDKVKQLESEISVKKDQFRQKSQQIKRSLLLKFIPDFQDLVMYHSIKSKSVYAQQMLDVGEFIEEIITQSSSLGKPIPNEELKALFTEFLGIKFLQMLKTNLKQDVMVFNSEEVEYYRYQYLRRVDGLGEFGIGPMSTIKQLLEESKGEVKLSKPRSQKRKDPFKLFINNDQETIAFYSGLYNIIQSDKDKIARLNLGWIHQLEIDVLALQKWRKDNFPHSQIQLSVKKTQESLQRSFGQLRGKDLYQNLFISPKRPQVFPYGVEIDGLVRIPHLWALHLEMIFLGESKGESKFQKYQNDLSLDFEKRCVPNKFKELGCEIIAGHKERRKGKTLFEVDHFALDPNNTLWVIESKSKGMHKRFFESYKSWSKQCRRYVDRPHKVLSFPQIVETIRQKLSVYQSQKIIPKTWKIREVKGLIVMQLPPFELEYKGIYLVWYREIDDFFDYISFSKIENSLREGK